MPLREVGAFHEWIERQAPNKAARSVVRTYLAELGDRPWAAPSVPLEELSNQPEDEIRTAILRVDDGVEVQIYAAGVTGDGTAAAVVDACAPQPVAASCATRP